MRRLLLVVALLTFSSFSSAMDGKALVLGIGLGAGMVVTRNYVALPVARGSKKVAKKTARTAVHVVTLGKK